MFVSTTHKSVVDAPGVFLFEEHAQPNVVPVARLDQYNRHQLTVSGLDGGTWTLKARAFGHPSVSTVATGIADGVIYQYDVLVDLIQVELAGLGVAAAPVATLTSAHGAHARG